MIKDKLLRIAGHLIEADVADLELADGVVRIKGVPGKNLGIAELAEQAHYYRLNLPEDLDLTSGLDTSYVYGPSGDRSTRRGLFAYGDLLSHQAQ